jgi:hypothetical protein
MRQAMSKQNGRKNAGYVPPGEIEIVSFESSLPSLLTPCMNALMPIIIAGIHFLRLVMTIHLLCHNMYYTGEFWIYPHVQPVRNIVLLLAFFQESIGVGLRRHPVAKKITFM